MRLPDRPGAARGREICDDRAMLVPHPPAPAPDRPGVVPQGTDRDRARERSQGGRR